MAKALWTGSISFGLVNIPVRLYAATESHQLELHQFDSKTTKRVRYKRIVEGTDDEVPYGQIVDGYEVSKGKVVLLTDDEMASAEPVKSRTLDLEDFVPLESIDPIAWNHTYYVGPEPDAGAEKAYAVLRDAMKQTERVGVGRFVMRAKQYLATLRPFGTAMALETMFFADEIRALADVPGATARTTASARELDMAKNLIDALAGAWNHDKYGDTYRDRLLALVKQKAKGAVVDVATSEPERGQVIDLMEALKQSLGRRAGGGAAKTKSDPSKTKAKSRSVTTGAADAARPARLDKAADAPSGGHKFGGKRRATGRSSSKRRAA